jgi:ribonucleotide reductase beta subunit family protein with ferritin-like domain
MIQLKSIPKELISDASLFDSVTYDTASMVFAQIWIVDEIPLDSDLIT